MIPKIKTVFSVIASILILLNIVACSHRPFRKIEMSEKTLNLQNGDRIHIVTIHKEKLECVFLLHSDEVIVVTIHNEDISKEVLIELDSIDKIYKHDEKYNKKPNFLISAGLIILFLAMFGYALMVSGLGSMGK